MNARIANAKVVRHLQVKPNNLTNLTGHHRKTNIDYPMFVLGINCNNDIVHRISATDYYVNNGVLIFPRFTRSVTISTHGRKPTDVFWHAATKIITNRFHAVDIELPWISEDEEKMVKTIQETEPGAYVSWYYMPTPESNPVSKVD